ncbi:MAG TPA: DUF5652 family protein [Patescibacteria group bacterium]
MENILIQHPWIIALIVIWSFPWKGVALWKAARNSHLGWFVVLLLLNTLAILDIIYIFVFSGNEKAKQEEANKQAYEPRRVRYSASQGSFEAPEDQQNPAVPNRTAARRRRMM